MKINNVRTEINITLTSEELDALVKLFEKTQKCTPYSLQNVLAPMIIGLKELNKTYKEAK